MYEYVPTKTGALSGISTSAVRSGLSANSTLGSRMACDGFHEPYQARRLDDIYQPERTRASVLKLLIDVVGRKLFGSYAPLRNFRSAPKLKHQANKQGARTTLALAQIITTKVCTFHTIYVSFQVRRRTALVIPRKIPEIDIIKTSQKRPLSIE